MTKGWVYAVNFERPETGPPVTVRGTVAAGNAAPAASRAVKAALKVQKGIRFESCVILLSRLVVAMHPETVATAGAKGGRARAKNLTSEALSEQGKKASDARWGRA